MAVTIVYVWMQVTINISHVFQVHVKLSPILFHEHPATSNNMEIPSLLFDSRPARPANISLWIVDFVAAMHIS